MESLHPLRLGGLKVALDVQHLWKPPPHENDHGSIYRLPNGTHRAEADLATIYAGACAAWLREHGAEVLVNSPRRHLLVGSYPARNRGAAAWGAHLYLACHVNSGGGDYALLEHMALNRGGELLKALAPQLLRFGIQHAEVRTIRPGQRGAICLEALPLTLPGVILEPFFGDRLAMQGLMLAPRLAELGQAIGAAVATWWESARPLA